MLKIKQINIIKTITRYYLMLCMTIVSISSFAQHRNVLSGTALQDIEIRVDTLSFSYNSNRVLLGGENYLPFKFSKNDQTIELRIFVRNNVQSAVKKISIEKSIDYDVLDSLRLVNNEYYQTRIRFKDIANLEFPSLVIKLVQGKEETVFIPLMPFTDNYATMNIESGDLYLGEETRFEILSNNIDNLKLDQRWQKSDNYEYRFIIRDGRAFFSVLPTSPGKIELNFQAAFKKSNYVNNTLNYFGKKQLFELQVRSSRINLLRFDLREIIWNHGQREPIELQLDNHPRLKLNQTYRIEDSDEKGGLLIGEFQTLKRLSNDKILCSFTPYNYHSLSDGYLYIKQNDNSLFIINLEIIPEPKIDRVSILRSGGTWVESNTLFPGETIEIRIEGTSLDKTKLFFEDLEEIESEQLLKNENISHYKLLVPIDIRKKTINIYSNNKKAGFAFNIQEKNQPTDPLILSL